jgi:cytochrome P450
MLAFLIAGFETISTSIAWFVWHMSKDSRVQAKLKKELAEHDLLGNEAFPSIEQLDRLNYFDNVIHEILRFTPNLDITLRTLEIDDRLPGTGVHLAKNETVLISLFNVAHDPRYWKIDPERFYPERFETDDKDHNPYALIPFGGGHRACIGQELARLEIKAVAVRLMQHVTFRDGGSEINAGGFTQKITVTPRKLAVYADFNCS